MVRTTIPTSGTTLDVSISSFGDVQAVIGFVSVANTNNSETTDGNLTIGFLDRQVTPNELNITQFAVDKTSGSSDTQRGYKATTFARCITTTGSTACEISFNSWITDGVKFNIDTNPSSARYLTCIFVGGSDVTNSFAAEHNLSNVTSVQDITAPGFEPDLVFLASANTSSSAVTDAQMSFGICHNDGAATQGNLSFHNDNSQTTTVVSGILRNNRGLSQVTSNTEDYDVTVSAFDASGFSVQCSASTSSDRMMYLALSFSNSPDISLDFIDGPTSTGNYSSTAPGFQPDFMMMLMSDHTAANTAADCDGFGIYGADASNDYINVVHATDFVAASNDSSLVADSIHDLTGTSSDLHVGTFSSFDATGFTLNFTTVPGTARKWAVLTVGPSGATAYTLTCNSGSYTYSGTATELQRGLVLGTDSGSYTYSGTAVALNLGYYLATDSGSYTYSGTNVTLTFASAGNFTLTCDSGSYSYSGTALSLEFGALVTATSGSYSYSGTNVTLTHDYPLALDSGSYSYSGTAVALGFTSVLAATSGSYAYTGSNVTLQTSGQIWTIQSNDSSTWTIQSNDSSTWTIQSNDSSTWTIQ